MKIKDWNIEAATGYTPISTFYMDMSIADMFGVNAIKDTYKSVVKCWLEDYKMFTEFVMVLNWKIWEHYKENPILAEVYDDLWRKAQDEVHEHFTEDELRYYYKTTD